MAASTQVQTCYRHPDRETRVSCSSCGRPICPDCMTPTPVGMRCPECARQRTKVSNPVRSPRRGAGAARLGTIAGVDVSITTILIFINVVAWLVELATSHSATSLHGTVFDHGALLGHGLEQESNGTLKAVGVDHGEPWRIVTGGFLHDPEMPYGILHIGFNMYLLYVLGNLLEPAYGWARFLSTYMVGLLGGSFGALLVTPDTLTVGASGAVFGLMGAAFFELRNRGLDPFSGGFGGIGGLIIINLVLSFSVGGISIGGHIGGLIAGSLATLAFQQAARHRQAALGWAASLVLAAASVAGCFAVAGGAGIG